MSTLRVAACHASPVFLSARGTTDKALGLISAAAHNSANLVVFPESFIPAFPIWSALRSPAENHALFQRMATESLSIDSEHIRAIQQSARQHRVTVSLGFSEKARSHHGTLWNSNLIIGADGEVAVHHRKLVATFFEKLTWAPGDGFGVRVAETAHGKIGALICGENTNPLARYALMAQGEQVHVSTWPAVWPTRVMREGQGEAGTGRNYDNVAANRTRAAAHCFEAKCFGVLCSGFLDQEAIEAVVDGAEAPDVVRSTLMRSPRGATMYLDPTGGLLPGFTMDAATGKKEEKPHLQSEEGILYCDMDLADCIEGKQYHDVVGGYQRLDVFQLNVDRSRREPARFVEPTQDHEDSNRRSQSKDKGRSTNTSG
ncbi:COP9 signalosome complex subunit 4 [Sphaceloma murrayae]|uniref:COP9 signalosome complex subunit 4 n=1 Tax=Sphaceloma murrayae TaxID=2082308 RepID=A0A2K1QJZ7_9PEZI|nr:COP9 signalosome complex subunit 4 [Sphaceloma murrayae]